MPSYDFSCPNCGKFDAYKRVGANSAPCPSCETESPKVFAVGVIRSSRAYDQQVDGRFPNARKPKEVTRQGGGKMSQTETGGYRPMVTHSIICPKEHQPRNVAVLADFPYGQRLACEACDYTWIYSAATAPNPLWNEVQEAYRPPRRIFMDASVPLHTGYTAPERGA